ncbi:MAG: hypothetical protein IPG77_01200 [Betaproteobacteria bacterium]|nr:hypothetical protein [Betaproteobacteria bacterium]
MTLPPMPQPDTHCLDDDTGKDVWSHSADQMRAYAEQAVAAVAGPCGSPLTEGLGLVPERTYTRAQLMAAIEAERHACSIAVWMTLQDALDDDADDKGLEGWMREAEARVKARA